MLWVWFSDYYYYLLDQNCNVVRKLEQDDNI